MPPVPRRRVLAGGRDRVSVEVPRTCRELREVKGPGSGVEMGESRPLSEFRSVPAYVLLGDPGAGKTFEFDREQEALGDDARTRLSVRVTSGHSTWTRGRSGATRPSSSTAWTRRGPVLPTRTPRSTRFAPSLPGSERPASASPAAKQTGSARTTASISEPSRPTRRSRS